MRSVPRSRRNEMIALFNIAGLKNNAHPGCRDLPGKLLFERDRRLLAKKTLTVAERREILFPSPIYC